MKLAMFTNTYLPQVGGVAISIDRFSTLMRKRGHDVYIVAPTYEDAHADRDGVHRVRALQNFDGSDFSVALPLDFDLAESLDAFGPDVIHAHHPFLLGNTAVRYAASRSLPLVFTHHTMYEHYTHYVPVTLETFKSYVVEMATGFANFCDVVIAPSESTAEILEQRGVVRPIRVAPTGVDIETFANGDGHAIRSRFSIPEDAFLIGTVGRLAPEKNLQFLAESIAQALAAREEAGFLVVGEGPSRARMEHTFKATGVADRVVFAGVLQDQALCNAYHAMDVFTFASKTETQGMVLVEALAAGCPVIAIDAPGAREVVTDGQNGRLLRKEDSTVYAEAIEQMAGLNERDTQAMQHHARETAEAFSTDVCVEKVLEIYQEAIDAETAEKATHGKEWDRVLRSLHREWDIWTNRLKSMSTAIATPKHPQND